MTDLFRKCVKVILKNEGGYGNHPADPGGETKYGIADAADGKKDGFIDTDGDGIGDVKVKDLTPEQALTIYYNKYWKPMNLEILNNEDLILQVFDMGVNAGTGRAIIILQQIIGADIDGKCGPQTASLVALFRGDITNEYKIERKKYYSYLTRKKPKYQAFINGWLKRVDETKFNAK